MKRTITIIILAAAIFFAGRQCGRTGGRPRTTTRIDTLVVRDTLRDTVPVPIERLITRVDTVWLHFARDTVPAARDNPQTVSARTVISARTADSTRVALPIERKTYVTDNYRAVVEGFRPALVELQLYPAATLVTRETTVLQNAPDQAARRPPRRWGLGIQAGYGLTPHGAAPYLGVGVQYTILRW